MSRTVTLAATQMPCDWDISGNVERAEQLVRKAASEGAQVILIQELFETPYFCIEQNPEHLALATTVGESATIRRVLRTRQGTGCRSPGELVRTRGQSLL